MDLKSTGSLEEAADEVLALYFPHQHGEACPDYEKGENFAELVRLKDRDGKLGITELYFDPAHMLFRPPNGYGQPQQVIFPDFDR